MTPIEVTADSTPGWVRVAADGLVGLIELSRDLPDEAVRERGAQLDEAARSGLVPLLEALAVDGLSGMPGFAIADTSGPSVRVLLRGEARLVRGEGGGDEDADRTLTAAGLLPWREVTLDAGELEELGHRVSLAAPEPEKSLGWRRPSFLTRVAEETAAEHVDQSDDAAAADDDGDDVADQGADEPADFGWGSPEPAPAEARPSTAAPIERPPAPPVSADYTLPPPEEDSGPPAERVPPSEPPKKSLIDSVPWRDLPTQPEEPGLGQSDSSGQSEPDPLESETTATSADANAPVPAQTPERTPEPAPEPVSVPEPEAAPEPAPAPAPPAPEASDPAAREGADVTMDRGVLRQTGDEVAPDSPVVLAVLCPAGHSSPPHAGKCRACGRDIPPQQPFQTPRPKLGVLRIATGGVVSLDRGVLLGRSPKVNADLPASSRPHLVRLASKDNDISRNHAEIILEGWHVLVRDLGSTNGTTVTLPGQEPIRLRPTEDHGIEPGTIITLADEVMLTYEVEE